MRSDTLHSHYSSVGGKRTICEGWLGIHLSRKGYMEAPSPTLQQIPFFKIGWPAKILFHTYELFGELAASIKKAPQEVSSFKASIDK